MSYSTDIYRGRGATKGLLLQPHANFNAPPLGMTVSRSSFLEPATSMRWSSQQAKRTNLGGPALGAYQARL